VAAKLTGDHINPYSLEYNVYFVCSSKGLIGRKHYSFKTVLKIITGLEYIFNVSLVFIISVNTRRLIPRTISRTPSEFINGLKFDETAPPNYVFRKIIRPAYLFLVRSVVAVLFGILRPIIVRRHPNEINIPSTVHDVRGERRRRKAIGARRRGTRKGGRRRCRRRRSLPSIHTL